MSIQRVQTMSSPLPPYVNPNPHLCEICGEGNVTLQSRDQPITYRNHTTTLPVSYKECDYCGSDYAGAEEMRMSRPAILRWKNEIDTLIDQSSNIDK